MVGMGHVCGLVWAFHVVIPAVVAAVSDFGWANKSQNLPPKS